MALNIFWGDAIFMIVYLINRMLPKLSTLILHYQSWRVTFIFLVLVLFLPKSLVIFFTHLQKRNINVFILNLERNLLLWMWILFYFLRTTILSKNCSSGGENTSWRSITNHVLFHYLCLPRKMKEMGRIKQYDKELKMSNISFTPEDIRNLDWYKRSFFLWMPHHPL